jgi:DNA polymerase III subunit chi
MTEVRFYHLQTKPLEVALPEILTRALEQNRRVVVRAPDKKTVAYLNEKLWTYRPDSFLPHGSAEEGSAAEQPVWLTDTDENPNGADVLILTGGIESASLAGFTLCCEMLEGQGEIVDSARQRWQTYKQQGHDVTYWQQDASGRWAKKA